MYLCKIKNAARKPLAGFMAVWLSGVLLLICCGTISGKSDDAKNCPLAAVSAHCDKGKTVKTSDTVQQTIPESIDCCSFFPLIFDKDRKIERTEQPVLVWAQPAARRVDISAIAAPSWAGRSSRSYTPDRRYTFVKNCMFRI